MIKKNKIVIITGGTGGHIIPSISIYKELLKLNWDIHWIINKESLKYLLNENINFNINIINSINFRKLNLLKKILYLFKLFLYIIHSKKILKNIKPDVVLGMGSYASVPGCISSWLNNIPLIIHEQNSVIGLANKILFKISNKMLKGICINNNKNLDIIFTGNPIRKSILDLNHISNRLNNKNFFIKVLILGGSQGSNFINELMLNVLKNINLNILVWHQVGNNNYNYICNKYSEFNITSYIYKIDEFIKDISIAYNWADILISRSGALTISETLYIGLPSILIPFNHKDKHQYFNALYLKKIGLSKIVFQSNSSYKDIIKYFLNINKKILYNMSINSKKFSKISKNSTNRIIYQLYKYIK